MDKLERVKRLFCGHIYASHCAEDSAAAQRAMAKILSFFPGDVTERGPQHLSFEEEDEFDAWMAGVVTAFTELEEKGGYFTESRSDGMTPRVWITYDQVVRSAAGPEVIAELDIKEGADNG